MISRIYTHTGRKMAQNVITDIILDSEVGLRLAKSHCISAVNYRLFHVSIVRLYHKNGANESIMGFFFLHCYCAQKA